MIRRSLWALLGIGVATWLGAILWVDYATHERPMAERRAESEGEAAIDAVFSLTDHRGREVTEADFAGQWLLVFFGFTNCPDICPTTLATIAQAMDALEAEVGAKAERVTPLFISVDPERDSPEALAEYVAAFHPSIVGLTGSPEALEEAAANFKGHFQKVEEAGAPDGYTMAHSAYVYLISPEGEFVRLFSYGATPDEFAEDLESRLEEDA